MGCYKRRQWLWLLRKCDRWDAKDEQSEKNGDAALDPFHAYRSDEKYGTD
jgi:hypothetical protein